MDAIETPVVIIGRNEQRYLGERDELEAKVFRLHVYLAASWALVVGLIGINAFLSLKGKPTYVVARDIDGQEYVLSAPQKPIDLRDKLIHGWVKQNLTTWTECIYRRVPATAEKDWRKAQWFMTDDFISRMRSRAEGPRGWIAMTVQGQIAASEVRVNSVVLRDADIQQAPYEAEVYLERITDAGAKEKWRVVVTFYVAPNETKGPMPLFNALGVFVDRVQETPDYTQ
jgi:hypothetical protein